MTDRLLEIHREACRVQSDRRLSDAGRVKKVAVLDDEIFELCGPVWCAELPPSEGPADDHRLLANELMKLMLAEQLFTFVTAAAVETPSGDVVLVAGTNNESERTLRSPAMSRDTGRTSKTLRGARRQTILHSVLETVFWNRSANISPSSRWERSWQRSHAGHSKVAVASANSPNR